MKLGVLDVGAHTVHLMVDVGDEVMTETRSVKKPVRLAARLDARGRLDAAGVELLSRAVNACLCEALRLGVTTLLAYATAFIRHVANGEDVVEAVRSRTGVRLIALPRASKVELAFLAARRWLGRQAGPLAVVDLGAHALEVGFGTGDSATMAEAFPLGAARLTREILGEGAATPEQVQAVRDRAHAVFGEAAAGLRAAEPQTIVGSSRMLEQLTRFCGADSAQGRSGAAPVLTREDLSQRLHELLSVPAGKRARLPGISTARSHQAAAGGIVAHCIMEMAEIGRLTTCPWAVREGVVLHHLERPPLTAAGRVPYGVLVRGRKGRWLASPPSGGADAAH
ncbi:Ppx/GppA family phosphatase [Streptomyces sp. NA04227]|uniref:Ppx/GppA phosphatase family protein n=1 Tax=Streptomyces sp. NA04227 TaxID=2742136 RepID=UPI0015900271|nr:Ppx/GppA family phosphatase [Streptomyces sp. NA04227]QKW05023.1 Ppx/GppA family phosphatase [Streptomyces sp. NA04227]